MPHGEGHFRTNSTNLNGWDATRDMMPEKLEMGSNTPAAGSFGEIIAAFTDEVDVTGDCA